VNVKEKIYAIYTTVIGHFVCWVKVDWVYNMVLVACYTPFLGWSCLPCCSLSRARST